LADIFKRQRQSSESSYQMKHLFSASPIWRLLYFFFAVNLMSCAVPQKTKGPASAAIDFTDVSFNDCVDCLGSQMTENPSQIDEMVNEDATELFENKMKLKELSKGKGFANASYFIANQKEALVIGNSNVSYWTRGQIVEFFQPRFPNGKVNNSGTGIYGTPTRVYLTTTGELSYLAFDEQDVALLELIGSSKKPTYSKIPRPNSDFQGSSFGSPIGKIKALADLPNQYTVEELKMFLGKEGKEVSIEFESGVLVRGTIERYIPSEISRVGSRKLSSEDRKAVMITFKDKSTTVNFGVHTLFKPSSGKYQMMILPELSNSNGVMPSSRP
jgi:hypothetical protein